MMNARATVLEDEYELQNLDNCCTDINANIIYEPVVARQQRARTYSGDILEETKIRIWHYSSREWIYMYQITY